jgi:predicted RNA-binding protein YlqC (UPF0109 family)
MEDLVRFMAESLVEDSDEVYVSAHRSHHTTVIHLRVASDDMGRVIGKGGRVANAMRDVLRAATAHTDKQIVLKIS